MGNNFSDFAIYHVRFNFIRTVLSTLIQINILVKI